MVVIARINHQFLCDYVRALVMLLLAGARLADAARAATSTLADSAATHPRPPFRVFCDVLRAERLCLFVGVGALVAADFGARVD